jgi:hypothetical protein
MALPSKHVEPINAKRIIKKRAVPYLLYHKGFSAGYLIPHGFFCRVFGITRVFLWVSSELSKHNLLDTLHVNSKGDMFHFSRRLEYPCLNG